MSVVRQEDAPRKALAPDRALYQAHTESLMMAVVDFNDGPYEQPDPPHHHPHEQVSYVASGEIIFVLDGTPHRMGPGDMISVPSNVPHSIQLLSASARLIDCFTPLRDEFLR